MGDRLSRERLADRSGVDPEYVDRLVSLGILTVPVDGTFAGSACQVVRLVRSFDGSGITPEHIGEAVRTGQLSLAFLDQPGYERFSGLSDTTFQEVSERSGIPLNVLTMTREAIGYGMAAPGDRMRDDELEAVPLIQLTHERGFEAEVLERLLRVYGESLRRVVETESASYRSQVLGPLLASGLSEFDALQRASRFTGEVFELLDRAIMGIYHGQQEHSWMRTIFETVEDGLDRAGVRSKVERPPAMCFVDLAGYTELTEEHGDAAAAATAVTLAPLVGVTVVVTPTDVSRAVSLVRDLVIAEPVRADVDVGPVLGVQRNLAPKDAFLEVQLRKVVVGLAGLLALLIVENLDVVAVKRAVAAGRSGGNVCVQCVGHGSSMTADCREGKPLS